MNAMAQHIVWLASYPGSGNTWLRVFLSNLLQNNDAPADINALTVSAHAASRTLFDLYAGVRAADLREDEIEELRPTVYEAIAGEQDTHCFMKIHDLFRWTPSGQPLISMRATHAVIYVIRNPLDVAVSYAHHRNADFDSIVATLADETHCISARLDGIDPQLRQLLGSWTTHVQSWTQTPLRLHVVRYEDMVRDPQRTFAALAEFAQIPHTPQQLQRAIEYSAFPTLQRQERSAGFNEGSRRAQRFFRRGEVGAWRDELSTAQRQHLIRTHAPLMQQFGYFDGGESLQ